MFELGGYGGDVETVTFGDLAPVLAAVLGPVLAMGVAIMRYQHVDSTKTIDRIDLSIENLRDRIDQLRSDCDGNFRELGHSLGDLRERVARIEGHLRISPPDGDGEAKAA
ncbi:hypothetical protein [Candidatus Poriferisocius sp.]|uniref:hypothetical protein n=1 Tax=Candidatus Poriferisocius sp. TaxID=3101276 RepID=UPI003B5CA857